MNAVVDSFSYDLDKRFKIFHELMARKVRDILLVSTPYDAYMLEEDGRLSERIINEYRGLNLSQPPRITWVSSTEKALRALDRKAFNMVITMPCIGNTNADALAREIKARSPDLPVILLSHGALPSVESYADQSADAPKAIDRIFMWTGNSDILLALVKSAEDRMNAAQDSKRAGIRVILFIEDSPFYVSSLLPILYKELVSQTQAVMEEGLNEEHRLLTMRARPKILLAVKFEEAAALFKRFEPYVLGVISDVRFPRQGRLDDNAGIDFLKRIKSERFDIPVLLASSDPANAMKAEKIPAIFVDKNSASLQADVRSFVKNHLGFGDFIFRLPDGREIARASNLRSLEKCLRSIPDESFVLHCNRNDFSRWLFARTETELASKVRPLSHAHFQDIESHRQYLIQAFHTRRKLRQKGVVVNFDAADFDLDTEFFKIGSGSLGGKARGLAYMSSLLHHKPDLHKTFAGINITIPQTLVITTQGFEAFVEDNNLRPLSKVKGADEKVAKAFLDAKFPEWLENKLRIYLSHYNYPLAIRSSSLLEDAQYQAYAGLYRTYMLPNDDPELAVRLSQLVTAVKLVWASTYFQSPKAFSKRVGQRTEEEQMAVMIQRLVGKRYGHYFYPAISGVAQSHNYYPFSKMKPEDGIATIALGLGKMVMEGEKTLRFSPRHPEILPQRSSVEDLLENSQRHFYALRMGSDCLELSVNESACLYKREVVDAVAETPVRSLASAYIPDEHRIRDAVTKLEFPVLTFARILKYRAFPLSELLMTFLALGEEGMGCPVEIEFSVNMSGDGNGEGKSEFAFLQIRPMTARAELGKVEITETELEQAFCVSHHALGNTDRNDLSDLVYVKPDVFDPARTPEIAREIGRMNTRLVREGRKYLLIGPGRWGSADRWLGIPVTWADISGVGAMVEIASDELKAEPSQGSHFFHNITTMGINYISITTGGADILNWSWITSLPLEQEDRFTAHAHLDRPLILKVDGRSSLCVMYTVF